MDATLHNSKSNSPRETYEDEAYRGYLITYWHNSGVFYVSKGQYHRGVSSLRKDAKRWIDLHIAGQVK